MTIERIWPCKDNLNEYLLKYPEHKQRYDFVCRLINNLDCADISCGAGYGSYLMGAFARSVDGFDVDRLALSHAKNNFIRDNVTFDNLKNIGNRKYDVISSIETIEHMNSNDGDIFLKKLHNALKKDGILIITTPLNLTKYKDNVTKYHIREYSDTEFKAKLEKSGFYINEWYGQSCLVSERLNKEIMGVSFLKIINTGMHRLIPKKIRNYLSKIILKKENKKVLNTFNIKKNDLKGAFSQIAICSLTPNREK